ncbi:MAG: transketolase [Verrucomicrobia bacterium]|nr:transketolase [Verrucomicrobiota bacterium]
MATLHLELARKGCELRRLVVEAIGVGHRGHFGGALSAADVVACLYFHTLRHRPHEPRWPDRDRFLLSKGHAAPAQYAALALAGYFPRADLVNLKELGCHLQGHPDTLRTPGVEANTGALGQGLSLANGMAIAARHDGRPSRHYVIIGDGELGEGQVWEAAMFSAARRLDNVCAIIDRNGIQATGPICDRMDIGAVADKWRAFGWHTLEIDGHDPAAIVGAFEAATTTRGRPTALVARTVKGKGISFAENTAAFHNNEFTADQYRTALAELDRTRAALTAP